MIFIRNINFYRLNKNVVFKQQRKLIKKFLLFKLTSCIVNKQKLEKNKSQTQ